MKTVWVASFWDAGGHLGIKVFDNLEIAEAWLESQNWKPNQGSGGRIVATYLQANSPTGPKSCTLAEYQSIGGE